MTRTRPPVDAYDSPMDGSVLDVRLTELLNAWAVWMHTGTYGRGYPRRSPWLRSGGGSDLTEMLGQGNRRLIAAVDAAVASLPHNEHIAILRAYSLTADVWRLREPWPDLEERARIMIREHLRQRRIE